ncbi:MAG: xanthine dehydrogenase family protein subunit M [Holophagaceae bacterium]|nr:xanthine dehydrogenase family protein subunit M [Holophagaceae bacterium]
MRGFLPDFDVRVPASLSEALELMAQAPGTFTPLAGGTDLMVVYNAGRLKPTCFLDLSGLAELRGIEEDATSLRFGALTTFTDLRECRAVHQHFPNLVKSARATGALAIQNRGTLAGNIANASPAADTPPSLLAYGAELELVSPRGLRRVAYDQFHQGYKRLDLAADELLARITVPKPSGRGFHYFRKVGTRQAQAISKTCLAAYARIEDGCVAELRIGLGSVAPAPVRARNAEAALRGQPLASLPVAAAREALLADMSPIDDIRATAQYRSVVTRNLLGQMLRELAGL